MNVLSTPRSKSSRSLPPLGYLSNSSNEIACFDELVYLGSHNVKKSFLVVNDNISSVLDHRDSREYSVAKIELYKDAIHLKNSTQDRLLDIHQLDWILSMGLFDEDRRYFGYISSKAFQGSKTRTSCHVFRCNRVGLASHIMETIRKACQVTYLARTNECTPEFRFRTNSNTSTSSEGSMSSNSETMSLGSTSSTPPEIERSQTIPTRMRGNPHFLQRRISRNRMTIIQSFTEEDSGNDTLGEETSTKYTTEEKPQSVGALEEKSRVQEEMSRVQEENPQSSEKNPLAQQELNPGICQQEESPQSMTWVPEKEPHREVRNQNLEKRFNVFYLISTIVSPRLKPKHVKDCLKQYQKSVDKAMKKTNDNGKYYKKAELVLSPSGVMLIDTETQVTQALYERAIISGVQSHPDGKDAFAFTTIVSGNTKHKCHLFLQDKDPIGVIVEELQTYIA